PWNTGRRGAGPRPPRARGRPGRCRGRWPWTARRDPLLDRAGPVRVLAEAGVALLDPRRVGPAHGDHDRPGVALGDGAVVVEGAAAAGGQAARHLLGALDGQEGGLPARGAALGGGGEVVQVVGSLCAVGDRVGDTEGGLPGLGAAVPLP